MSTTPISPTTCVVRNTAGAPGRTLSVTPETTAARHLHYGRIVLAGAAAPLRVDASARETGLVCLKGSATVAVGGQTYELAPYDALYVPRDSAFDVTASANGCDLAEISAPVETRYPVQFVSYAKVQQD